MHGLRASDGSVVVNPAAGHDEPVLATLNDAFSPRGGLGRRRSRTRRGTRDARAQAVEDGADVVAAYGGDGTVMEVAGRSSTATCRWRSCPAARRTCSPADLGVPPALADAASLLVEQHALAALDVGESGRRHFVLRLAAGSRRRWTCATTGNARTARRARVPAVGDRGGRLDASSHYRLTVDGQRVEAEGVSCIVANSGALGMAG